MDHFSGGHFFVGGPKFCVDYCIGAQTIHLFLFNQNGQGFFLLDLISNVLQMNSQIVIVGLFILIAFGWEITDVDLSKDNKLIFLGGGILVTHTIIAYLTAFDDGEHHKYHDYGGFQGLALISIRFILYGIFLYGVVTTLPKVNAKVKGFLKALSAAGTLYMLTFPTLWFFSFIITAHLRNRLIVFGNLLAQLFAIIIMLNQFSKKGTRFYEVANKSKDILSGKDK